MTVKFIGKSVAVITALSAMGSLVALLVDAAIAANFGTGRKMDAYLTAMVIPGIIATLVPSTISNVFVPVFHMISHKDGEKSAWRVASMLLNLIFIVMALVTIVLVFISDGIIAFMVPGFSPDTLSLSASLFRWMLVWALFVSLNALLSSYYNATHRFGLPALMPLFQNVITVIAVFFLARMFDIYVLAFALIAGGVLQFIVLSWGMVRRGCYSLELSLRNPDLHEVLRLSLLMMIGAVSYGAFGISDRYFGSLLPEGSISYLGYGTKLGMFFANLIGIGIGTVSFSKFSAQAAAGRQEELAESILMVTSALTLAFMPAMAVMLALREPLLGLIFERRAFGHGDVVQTGWAMLAYAGLFLTYGIGRPVNAAFYSLRDITTPVIINVAALVFYVPLTFFLSRSLSLGFIGIALASSIIHMISFTLYVVILAKRIPELRWGRWIRYFLKICAISVGIATACIGCLRLVTVAAPAVFAPGSARIMALLCGGGIWLSAMMYLRSRKDPVLLRLLAALPLVRRFAS